MKIYKQGSSSEVFEEFFKNYSNYTKKVYSGKSEKISYIEKTAITKAIGVLADASKLARAIKVGGKSFGDVITLIKNWKSIPAEDAAKLLGDAASYTVKATGKTLAEDPSGFAFLSKADVDLLVKNAPAASDLRLIVAATRKVNQQLVIEIQKTTRVISDAGLAKQKAWSGLSWELAKSYNSRLMKGTADYGKVVDDFRPVGWNSH